MQVSQGVKEECGSYFLAAAKIGAIGGGITTLACAIFSRDYVYPCTITLLSAFTWININFTKSTQQDALNNSENNSENKSKNEILQDFLEGSIDELSEKFKENLNKKTAEVIDLTINVGKTAAVTMMPLGLGSCAGASIDMVGSSAKSTSNKIIGFSVNRSTKSAKNSVQRSIK